MHFVLVCLPTQPLGRWAAEKAQERREHSKIHQPFLILPEDVFPPSVLLKIRTECELPAHQPLLVFLFLFRYHPIFFFFTTDMGLFCMNV